MESRLGQYIHWVGLCLFWSVWFCGLVDIAARARVPEAFRDGVVMVFTGRSPGK